MAQQQIAYKNSSISYEQFGSGEEYIIAFHGFGQAAYRWNILSPYLDRRFTLIAFDLPFHGHTRWNKNDRFTPEALLHIIQKILPSNVTKVYILGYSMGGRIALGLLQFAPQQIKKVVLLAPDGLHRNKWYRFATHTAVGRRLFYNTMKNPTLLFRFAQQLKTRGMINDYYYNMAQHYMLDEETRIQLFYRWVGSRDFHPNAAILKHKIAKHHVPVDLIFAKHDRIIVANHGIEFAKGLEQHAKVHIIDAGHSLLQAQYAPYIASFFTVK